MYSARLHHVTTHVQPMLSHTQCEHSATWVTALWGDPHSAEKGPHCATQCECSAEVPRTVSRLKHSPRMAEYGNRGSVELELCDCAKQWNIIRFFKEKYLKPHFGNVSWEGEF